MPFPLDVDIDLHGLDSESGLARHCALYPSLASECVILKVVATHSMRVYVIIMNGGLFFSSSVTSFRVFRVRVVASHFHVLWNRAVISKFLCLSSLFAAVLGSPMS